MEHVILIVSYDPAVVSYDYLAQQVMETEGVANVKIKDGD